MIVGFSGTRLGMTEQQTLAVRNILFNLRSKVNIFHHGSCVGSDVEAARIAKQLGYVIHSHPADDVREMFQAEPTGFVWVPKPALARNLLIVNASKLVIATPKNRTPQVRGSGTWHVIRTAIRKERALTIIFPNGEMEVHSDEDTDA